MTHEFTTPGESSRPVVLVVEDEVDIAAVYRRLIEPEYTVQLAASGEEALAELDDDVDVVVLDRMLPGMQGDELLGLIRERGFDCRVAMLTAVEPDLDIVEMGFDAYIQKPPTRAQLRGTVADLLARSAYTAELQEYCSALSKRAALSARPTADLAESPEYAALEARIAELKASLDESVGELTDDVAFLSVLRSIEKGAGGTA